MSGNLSTAAIAGEIVDAIIDRQIERSRLTPLEVVEREHNVITLELGEDRFIVTVESVFTKTDSAPLPPLPA